MADTLRPVVVRAIDNVLTPLFVRMYLAPNTSTMSNEYPEPCAEIVATIRGLAKALRATVRVHDLELDGKVGTKEHGEAMADYLAALLPVSPWLEETDV